MIKNNFTGHNNHNDDDNTSFTFSYTQTKDEIQEIKEKFQQVFTKEINETLFIHFKYTYNQLGLYCKPTEKSRQFTFNLPSLQIMKQFKNIIKFKIIDKCCKTHLLLLSIQFINYNKNNLKNKTHILLLGRLKLKYPKSLFFCNLNQLFLNKKEINELINEKNTIKKMLKEINKIKFPENINLNDNVEVNNSYFNFNKKIKQIDLNTYLIPCRMIGENLNHIIYLKNKQFWFSHGLHTVSAIAEWGSENYLKGEIKVKGGVFFTKKMLNSWHQVVTTDRIFVNALFINDH
ncbi:hypothetical protein ABK040_012581 [Willaertia magna]